VTLAVRTVVARVGVVAVVVSDKVLISGEVAAGDSVVVCAGVERGCVTDLVACCVVVFMVRAFKMNAVVDRFCEIRRDTAGSCCGNGATNK